MDSSTEYPMLAPDIEAAERIVVPVFERADAAALRFQKLHRWGHLIVILGAVVAVWLGVEAATRAATGEAAETGGTGIWSNIQAVLTGLLGAITLVATRLHWHEKSLDKRGVAETLRGEVFGFVGRLGPYAHAPDPERALKARTLAIERGRGIPNG
jgi:hypothetical protein